MDFRFKECGLVGWLVVLRFNATLTAKIISWRSVRHMCFLAFSHQYLHEFFPKPPITSLAFFTNGERRKYAGKEFRFNLVSHSQPPGHESDTLTTEPPGRGLQNVGQTDVSFLWHLSKTLPLMRSSIRYFENHVSYFVQNRRK